MYATMNTSLLSAPSRVPQRAARRAAPTLPLGARSPRPSGHVVKPSASRLHAAAADGVEVQSESLAALKRAFTQATSGTRRGKETSMEQRKEILDCLGNLEAANPTPNITESELVSGWWQLVWQGPLNDELAAKDRGERIEGPFLALFQPIVGNAVRTVRILQFVDKENGRCANVQDFRVFNKIDGSLKISGICGQSAEQPGDVPTRVDVEFKEFELTLGKMSVTIPLTAIRPRGWVDYTFLDEEMCVGHGQRGSVFAISRLESKDDPAAMMD